VPDQASRLRIIVLGYLIRGPLGGMAWHHLQYVLGLAQLGHDVYFIEDSDDYASCYDPQRDVMDIDPSYGLAFADRTFHRLGLGDRWCYYDGHASKWLGPLAGQAIEVCRSADLLLNVSGVNPLRDWTRAIPIRALVDTDPVFTQIRHLTDAVACQRAAQHNAFFSFGENIGHADCHVPDDRLPWQPTRQPVVLDAWHVSDPNPQGAFTTIMQWESYPTREYDGCTYGMKSASFEPFFNMPERIAEPLGLALGGTTAPRNALADLGWKVTDSFTPTRDPWAYQHYIQESKAEFSVAKHGYVVTRSGWFSERTTSYLASGRPALVQDTGFTQWLETGTGILAFSSPTEAVEGLAEISRHYTHHCQAAREIVEAHFDARTVLESLIERAYRPLNKHADADSVRRQRNPNP
jgi:hypothetical protein